MSSPFRRTSAVVAELLFKEPHRFDFFQAVRLLEWIFRERYPTTNAAAPQAPVGGDALPDQECVRFRVDNSFNFPASVITHLSQPEAAESKGLPCPPQMKVSFMGLTGPGGVLPEHYTELLLQRIRYHKDHALKDFFDVFNHRSISLFYRAWEKYRAPFLWERSQRYPSNRPDPFTNSLRCLVGLGTPGLSERLQIPQDVPLYYAGYFAHRPRSAIALEMLLSDFLNLPVLIKQFQGRWLYLDRTEQTRLPGAACPAGQYLQLGFDAVLGERVWDVRSCFYICMEGLTYPQFVRLMPEGDDYPELCRLTRLYVGVQFTFAVQPVLTEDQLPGCRLGKGTDYRPRLGWNTWLSNSRAPAERNETDAPLFFWKDLDK